MTRARTAVTIVVAFVLANVFAALIHGYVLGADYLPFEGTLLRANGDGGPAWQMAFLPIVHLAVVASLVWVYGRLRLAGSTLARGLKAGVLLWTMGQLPVWLLWYAEQPWPGNLLLKQLGLELVSSLVIGVTIAAVARVAPAEAAVA
jgi:hypothetical protein